MPHGEADKLFTDGEPYERLMGCWSRVCRRKFLGWLNAPKALRWLAFGPFRVVFYDIRGKNDGRPRSKPLQRKSRTGRCDRESPAERGQRFPEADNDRPRDCRRVSYSRPKSDIGIGRENESRR